MSDSPFRVDPSTTAAFKALKDESPLVQASRPLRAVVIGGGTGAPISIRTLLSMGVETSAVVAMADDGGSTGILREEANVTPPGDIRKCLAAFAHDPNDPLTRAFKYRFEFARNHTLGNLMLSALEEATGSFPEAIHICENLLGAEGHVYPSTLDRVNLEAQTYNGQHLCGQARASASDTALERVWLTGLDRCRPYTKAMQAIQEADLVVLGPGSLFTSIIPNLLVPGIVDAIARSKAKTLFVCSLADMQGETRGMSAKEHVESLCSHGMQNHLDYVLIHSAEPLDSYGSAHESKVYKKETGKEIRPVPVSFADIQAIQAQGSLVLVRNLVDAENPTWHDPHALRNAFIRVLNLCRLPQI